MMQMAGGQVLAKDGTPIAYKAGGSGPALVFTNGLTTSDFYWHNLLGRLGPRARVVTWDLKGHGRSGPARELDQVSIESSVDDLARVMDAAEVDTAVLVGFSVGCQIILEAWRHFPERIRALVPVLGTYGRPFNQLLHPALGPWLHRLLATVGPRLAGRALKLAAHSAKLPLSFELNQLAGIIGRRTSREQMAPFFEHLARIDARTWLAMALATQQHSAWDVLDSIEVPVLILAGDKDVFTPVDASVRMAEQIPGSELVLIDGASHTGLFEFPDEIGARLERFLEQHQLLA